MDISQIQIIPVENGFFIQVVNADGSGTLNPRRVASDRDDLVKQIKELADGLYTKNPPKAGEPQVPPTGKLNPPVEPPPRD
jgi:hypothetical protein